jgi:iron complex outermembrane receptor protein
MALAMALCLCGGALAAEQGAEDAQSGVLLKEEVVVASPVIEGNQVSRYGGVKTVVGQEQIHDLNAQDVTNALRTTPGVTISRYNAIGSFGGGEGGAVFIRGMGSTRPGGEIKTTIDGVKPGQSGVQPRPHGPHAQRSRRADRGHQGRAAHRAGSDSGA